MDANDIRQLILSVDWQTLGMYAVMILLVYAIYDETIGRFLRWRKQERITNGIAAYARRKIKEIDREQR